ncbi:MAG TPA: SDR family oxidoreductase [Stackebrandtia sp.]|jgi:3-oxoacyl-[acyl-carrier protein] reductase|uniref:SDR family NAD(P)-dependent oxidoreductase n=1 Tax=Stackebrandtia sp. TaxID=2023065 RepID=UPI002D4CB966|nr:SDR family oxidoreductase [Stackebrandtia sp.]HZE37293.1 SDR family oxidoreductase [Stackebrandtia sp.]
MADLDNKIALVTGASRGIGRAIAERLAADGAVVAVHYGFNADAADEVVREIRAADGRAFAIGAELGTDGDAEALFAAFDAAIAEYAATPALDILVNNAGVLGPGAMPKVTPEGLDRIFAINVKAPFFIARLALERMRDNGRVINVSSGASLIPWTQDPGYGMSKAALDSLTLTLAKAAGERGITVNSVGPGPVRTDMNREWLIENESGAREAAAVSVFNRVGEPADIADAVAFLASPQGRWVTGHWLDATGGALLRV